jgi:hypothetical protein
MSMKALLPQVSEKNDGKYFRIQLSL